MRCDRHVKRPAVQPSEAQSSRWAVATSGGLADPGVTATQRAQRPAEGARGALHPLLRLFLLSSSVPIVLHKREVDDEWPLHVRSGGATSMSRSWGQGRLRGQNQEVIAKRSSKDGPRGRAAQDGPHVTVAIFRQTLRANP